MRRHVIDSGEAGTYLMARSDPSALRWLIGVELGNYRRQAGLTLAELSAVTGISKPKLGHMESGRQQQFPDDVATFLSACRVEHRDIDRLASLAGRADDKTWWGPWKDVVPDWFRTFVGLEGLAAEEFVYEPTVVPGLLQTEDYARELTRGARRVRPDHSERVVQFRMARARRLHDAEPLNLHTVFPEAALRLNVGTAETRKAQCEHLVKLAQLPNVTIQVVRPADGPHAAGAGQFAVLGFQNVRSVAYVELQDGAVYIQDPDDVEGYTMTAKDLQRVALQPDDSIALIQRLIA